ALQRTEALAQVHHPMREEAERERMRHRELDHVLAGHLVAAHHVARGLQAAEDLERLRMEGLAGGREPGRVRRTVDQVEPGPCFERLDATRERRLRDMAQLRGTREAARRGEA